MLYEPGTAYRCGTFALYHLGRVTQGENFAAGFVLGTGSPTTGFSLASLLDLAGRAGLAVVPAQRMAGQQLVVPSVVHFAVDHYAAIVDRAGDMLKVMDPAFGEPRWLSAEAINTEASGYFLLPANLLQPGWRVLAPAETAAIYGRGYATSINDNQDGPRPIDFSAPSIANSGSGAPAPAAAPGSASGLLSLGAFTSSPGDLGQSSGRQGGGSPGAGLAVWSVSEPWISLWLDDQPLSYTPSRGIPVAFHLAYHQRDQVVQDTDVFNVGKLWGTDWRSYVKDYFINNEVMYCPGGDTRQYTGDGTTMEYTTHTRLKRFLDGSGNLLRFELYFQDGRTNIYGFVVPDPTYGYTNKARAFLTKMLDTAGQGLTLNYTTNSTGIFLSSITDPDGNSTTLSYGNSSYPLQVTAVTDPYSRSCSLQYSSTGLLTNITDTASQSSGFIYDSNGWITNLTTPYGTTAFTITGANIEDFVNDPTNSINRSITIQEPTLSHQLYAYRQYSSTLWNNNSTTLIPAAYSGGNNVPGSSPVGTLDNNGGDDAYTAMYNRNTFYWDRAQYAALSTTTFSNFTTNDYLKARLRHWLFDSSGMNVGQTVSMERAPSPDATTVGQMTWYDYYGKRFTDYEGTNREPDTVIQVHPDGNTWYVLYARNPLHLVSSATDRYTQPNGSIGSRTWTYTYAANNIDVVQVLGPNNEVQNGFGYSSLHEILSATNAVGDVTTTTFDSYGRLSTRQYPSGTTRTWYYGTDGRVSRLRDSGINANQYYTWANGLLSTYTDARGLQVTLTWDNLSRVIGMSYPDGTTISNRYTALDLTATKDRLGNWSHFAYNGIRQKTSQTDPNNNTTYYGYCDCGMLNEITNALSQVTSFNYDLAGRQTNVVFADGTSRSSAYNRLGQLTSVSDNLGSTTYAYNLQGLQTNVSNASGTQSGSVFDNEDRATTVIDANGVTVTQSFDYLGRVLSRTYPDSGVEYWQYWTSGVLRHTNQLGNVWQYGYDVAGRVTSEITPNNETNSFGYTAAGDQNSLSDAGGHVTTWAFSVEGLMTNKTVNTGAIVETNLFDANHRLTLRWTPASGSQSYSYDAVGNNTQRTNPAVTNYFDALNRLTNMVDSVGTTTWTFTPAGDLASEIGPWANSTVTSTYDPNVPHLRVGLSLQQPSSTWTNGFTYDAVKRMATVTSPAGTHTYTYNGPGNTWTNLAQPPGSKIAQPLDNVARVSSTALINSGGTTLNSHGYAYNKANQRTQQTRTDGNTVTYGYDPDGQLQSAVGSGGFCTESLGYKYDVCNNLNVLTNGASTTSFAVDGLNQLTNGPTSPYGYDANGNQTRTNNCTYGYDAADRLASITSGTTFQTILTYDGLSRLRVRQENTWSGSSWVLSSRTYYIYDGRRVIQERDVNNNPTTSYTRGVDMGGELESAGGIGGLLALSTGYSNGSWTSHYFYHADANGNVTYLIDSSQATAAVYRHDPFGNTFFSSGTMASANVYRFSSKEQLANSGHYYYGYRFYGPNLQRWVNRDPVGESGGINLYCFARNNGVSNVDPQGQWVLKWWDCTACAAALVGKFGGGIAGCAVGCLKGRPSRYGYGQCIGDCMSMFLSPSELWKAFKGNPAEWIGAAACASCGVKYFMGGRAPHRPPTPPPPPEPPMIHCKKISDEVIEGIRVCEYECSDGNNDIHSGDFCDSKEYWKTTITIDTGPK